MGQHILVVSCIVTSLKFHTLSSTTLKGLFVGQIQCLDLEDPALCLSAQLPFVFLCVCVRYVCLVSLESILDCLQVVTHAAKKHLVFVFLDVFKLVLRLLLKS